MRPRALVVLNPAAGGGRAARRFAALRPVLATRFRLSVVSGPGWRRTLEEALRDDVDCVLAAGGDGTLHAVAGVLLEGEATTPLGALALGSSNDFHKQGSRIVCGVPARIDAGRPVVSDVVRVDCDGEDRSARRHFLVSASCGVVASGNARFNRPGPVLRRLKRLAPNIAVLAAAADAIRRYRPVAARLAVDGVSMGELAISTLNLLKTPWLAGRLRFDTDVDSTGGRMAVNLGHDMSRLELLRLLVALSRGVFVGLPRTRHWMAGRVRVEFAVPSLLELDGEAFRVRSARFEVLPRRLTLCG